MAGNIQDRWRETWFFFRHHWLQLATLTLPVAVPLLLWMHWRLIYQLDVANLEKAPLDPLIEVLSLVFNMIMGCAVVHAVDGLVKGQTLDWRAHWANGISRGPVLMLAVALLGLGVAAGLLLLVIPGLFLLGRLALCQVLIPLEPHLSATDALKRSFHLSSGHVLEMLAGVFGLGLLSSIVMVVVELVAAVLGEHLLLRWVWSVVGHSVSLMLGLLVPVFLYRQYELLGTSGGEDE